MMNTGKEGNEFLPEVSNLTMDDWQQRYLEPDSLFSPVTKTYCNHDPSAQRNSAHGFLCEVSKLGMDDWQKRYLEPAGLKPAIKAYYRNVPPAERNSEQCQASVSSRSKCPHRIAIVSRVLQSELEEISELIFADTPVL